MHIKYNIELKHFKSATRYQRKATAFTIYRIVTTNITAYI